MPSEHIQLSELEMKVMTTLGEQGPMSGYDFHLGGQRQRGGRKALMSSGYWIKVLNHIGPKGLNLINRVNLSHYHSADKRGRRKDLYWLTERGLIHALSYNVSTKKLLENTKKVYPDEHMLFFIVEMREVLGEKAFTYALNEVLKLEDFSEESMESLVMKVMVYGLIKARELSPTSNPYELKQNVDNIIKKYPEIRALQHNLKKRIKPELDILFSG